MRSKRIASISSRSGPPANDETISNIRLWRPDVLRDNYISLQRFRSYYEFNDVDVDRYVIDGQRRVLMISTREVSQAGIPAGGRTWQNVHLQYTHGFGAVASQVNTATTEGQPVFTLRDIPPLGNPALEGNGQRVYYGEGAPVTLPYRPNLEPRMPNGYDYDGCDSSVLKQITVKDGLVVLPSGMSYRVLVLPNTTQMTPKVAMIVRDLVAAGATVVGPKPDMSPSLSDFPNCDAEVGRTSDDVWADLDGIGNTERRYGKGRVVWNKPLEDVFD